MAGDMDIPPIFVFLLGFFVGTSYYENTETIQLLKWLINVFASIYTLIVLLMIMIVSFQQFINTITKYPKLEKDSKRYQESKPSNDPPVPKSDPEPEEQVENKEKKSVSISSTSSHDNESESIDLNGSFRLEKNINFVDFLAAQGVSWALRVAANKAVTTHHITHKNNQLKIRVQGIINSETEYIINGPPIESKVKDRVYLDYVSYVNNKQGVQVLKVNKEHDYNIKVVRTFSSPDKSLLVVTSTATFSDGKIVQAIQHYRRLETQ